MSDIAQKHKRTCFKSLKKVFARYPAHHVNYGIDS